MKSIYVNAAAQFQQKLAAQATKPEGYSLKYVLKTRESFARGSKLLGKAANAMMSYAEIASRSKAMKKTIIGLIGRYPHSMEPIVDASVQGDSSEEAIKSMDNLKAMLNEIIILEIKLSKLMAARIKGSLEEEYRAMIVETQNTIIDRLYSFIKDQVNTMDLYVKGEGYGDTRVPGIIDSVRPDYTHFICDIPNYLERRAKAIRGEYSNAVKAMLAAGKDLSLREKSEYINEHVKAIQTKVLVDLSSLKHDEAKAIVKYWANQIYRNENGYMFDAILFIDMSEHNGRVYEGTFDLFLEVLQDLGLAKQVDAAQSTADLFKVLVGQRQVVEKAVVKNTDAPAFNKEIRVWRSRPLGIDSKLAAQFVEGVEVLVEGSQAVIANTTVNVKGQINDGIYRIVEFQHDKAKEDMMPTGGKLLLAIAE
jgi:hypothetical protein